jgi:CubicO group peptidase (beta-lactamase class C family)
MKKLLSFLKWTALVLTLIVGGLYATGNGFLIKGVWATYLHGFNSASIGDARFFATHTIKAGTPRPWPVSKDLNTMTLTPDLRQSLEETRSVAFLIVQGGELLHEEYWDGYGPDSRSNSFSMAKSVTTMLAQCAIQDGRIKSWDQPVRDFLPGLQGPFADELTLRHLSTMTAGLDFNEHYTNPFDITAKLYYGPDAEKLLLENVPVVRQPGKGSYEYQSGATQLLGLCVMKATGRPLAEYASEKLWKPLGAEHDALWHTDAEGHELAFCCFNTNARDFARFGQMMLNGGSFGGRQILDSAFVSLATQPYGVDFYGHAFWLYADEGTPVFYQRGILGQYIIVFPEYDMVVVRLGHERRGNDRNHSEDFRTLVHEVLAMMRGGAQG